MIVQLSDKEKERTEVRRHRRGGKTTSSDSEATSGRTHECQFNELILRHNRDSGDKKNEALKDETPVQKDVEGETNNSWDRSVRA